MSVINKNKKAYFEYSILEDYVAGISLLGSEVKSIKASKVSISEAYCYIHNNEMFIKGMHVAEYKQSGKYQNHDPIRERKLLLNKVEIIKIGDKINQKGMTLIPLNIHTTKTGLIKIKIGLCKGKKLYDKRQSLKEKDIKRDLERGL
jgi:SsrA-binding protein